MRPFADTRSPLGFLDHLIARIAVGTGDKDGSFFERDTILGQLGATALTLELCHADIASQVDPLDNLLFGLGADLEQDKDPKEITNS